MADSPGATGAPHSRPVAEDAIGAADRRPVAKSAIRPDPPVEDHRGWQVSRRRSASRLRLADLSPLSKVEIRADPASRVAGTLATRSGQAIRSAGHDLVAGTGPDRWLVLGPAGSSGKIIEVLGRSGGSEAAAIIDVTHGKTLVRLTGADAARVLEKICAINLSDAVTPPGTCFRSAVARVVCDVIRDDVEQERSYLIACDRSYGQYLFDTLKDAGSELGADVDGFPDKEI